MIKKISVTVLKIIAYLAFVAVAVYYTPKLLSKWLNTEYPLATITSGSMWPALKENDLILMKGIRGEEAQIGQIIIFKNQWGFTIHRLIRKENNVLVTKGDANSVEDAPIAPGDVIGRIVYVGKRPFRIPFLGLIAKNFGPQLSDWVNK